MPPHPCERCKTARAQILRPKNHSRLCAPCFISAFEAEVAETITSTRLFQPNERIAIGASGGKDSTVLAAVLQTLNNRHSWNLRLELLSIDEGITGYRDHSLEAVKRHAEMFDLPLTIVSYKDLYGWSMDQVVAQVGKKGNCTYCGVFRRQALDRGAAALGVKHVVTGHNADDVAETVLMNLLRGDLPRLSRATSIVTSMPSAVSEGKEGWKVGDGSGTGEVAFTEVKRSKPLMYAYEKEIVLYAHHRKLDYFSTECIYSPEAFRGSARTLIKNLERIRPESILDVVRSGIDMAKLVPGADGDANGSNGQSAGRRDEEEQAGGCGSTGGGSNGREMAEMEDKLLKDEQAEAQGLETEVTFRTKAAKGQRRDKDDQNSKSFSEMNGNTNGNDGRIKGGNDTSSSTVPIRTKQAKQKDNRSGGKEPTAVPKQKLGQCERCGYLSSQAICKACVLLEGLNKARPRTGIEVGSGNG